MANVDGTYDSKEKKVIDEWIKDRAKYLTKA